jgi:hypothetical protein
MARMPGVDVSMSGSESAAPALQGSCMENFTDVHAAPTLPSTRLHHGIRKPKVYTDGTVRYIHLVNFDEPHNLQEAHGDDRWKRDMDAEYDAL